MDVRIEGLYDIRTVNFLIEQGIHHFGFDFNPKSLNFIQYHLFLEIYAQYLGKRQNTYLNFENDSPLIINHHTKALSELIEREGFTQGELPLYLELADGSQDYLSKFELGPFRGILPHYRPGVSEYSLKECCQHEKVTGIFLHYADLLEMHHNGTLFPFVQNFYEQTLNQQVKNQDDSSDTPKEEFKVGLISDWQDDLYQSILDLFDFDLISFKISGEVEVCFRNVDLNKVGKSLGQFTGLSL